MFWKRLNSEKIRKDFSVLDNIKGIYLDSACMSLKPKQVIEKMNEYYLEYPGCAGRSLHKFGRRLEEEISKARHEIARFIKAKDKEIVFTKNATEAINLVANGLDLKKDDEVIIGDKEHSSNLIPWLKLKKEVGIKVIIWEEGENIEKLFNDKTRLVSIFHVSNLDGVKNDIAKIAKISHKHNVKILVDGAQSVPHVDVNVKKLDVDFFVFSGHKMLGPTGTGILYGKFSKLEKLREFIVGGETIIDSTYSNYVLEEIPMRFEAGLQNYSGIIGLGSACKYLKKIGMKNISKHEKCLVNFVENELKNSVEIIGSNSGIFNFNIKGMDSHHVAKILDSGYGIMVRSGAHCVHEWYNKHSLKGSVRASFYLYNTEDEAEKFVDAVKEIAKLKPK